MSFLRLWKSSLRRLPRNIDGPGPALQHVRTYPSRGSLLRAGSKRQPLRAETDDAKRIRRSERCGGTPEHHDHRHGMPEGQDADQGTEAREHAQNVQEGPQEIQAGGVRKGRTETIRTHEEEQAVKENGHEEEELEQARTR